MTRRLFILAAAILARLGLLWRPALREMPVPRVTAFPFCPAVPACLPGLSLGLPGRWTPMTGSEP